MGVCRIMLSKVKMENRSVGQIKVISFFSLMQRVRVFHFNLEFFFLVVDHKIKQQQQKETQFLHFLYYFVF